MAGSTICKRVIQSGNHCLTYISKFSKTWNSSSTVSDISEASSPIGVYSASLYPCGSYLHSKRISQLVPSHDNRLFLVDTLALVIVCVIFLNYVLSFFFFFFFNAMFYSFYQISHPLQVKKLESQGIPTKHAEAITAAVIKVLNDSLEHVAHSFTSKAEIQEIEMIRETKSSKFKSEVQSSQGHHFGLLQREIEKFKGDIEKLHNELRYEIDKVNAGQRLNVNLEKGRIRDELANQHAEATSVLNELNREIHELRAQFEAAKYDVIKYCIGTLVSLTAIGLAVIRILK